MILSERRLAELAGLSESISHASDEQTRVEEGLRKAIRQEIEKVLAEVLASNDGRFLQHAQTEKSVSTAMGFAGTGFANSSRSQHPVTNHYATPPSSSGSRTLGFKGPGF